MKFHRNIKHDQTTCTTQEPLLLTIQCLELFPFEIDKLLHNLKNIHDIFMKLCGNINIIRRHAEHKSPNSCLYSFFGLVLDLVMYCRWLLYSVCIGPTACLHLYLLPIIAGTNTAFYLMVSLPILL